LERRLKSSRRSRIKNLEAESGKPDSAKVGVLFFWKTNPIEV
jgi:hypothetical protein